MQKRKVMNKKYVNEIIIDVNETEADIEFTVPSDLFWFKGHFPIQPLLPGVAQLSWVIYYAQKCFGKQLTLSSMDLVKFQCPVLPEDHLILHLVWYKETNKLEFKYTIVSLDNNKKVASSGRLTLCP
ncbi:hypothetical protein A9G35_04515 [Gilliamella sp. Choc5-1]|jgi:3-hydroxymyristoyl/3-hydroxydecanoyl-(acyl carrier protein) dehydratase|uniref:ApeI family dehydratase n=1 Tax=Gilliamella sp. Choc5-1 TaxID=3120238 RepID=UPI00080E7113|nr:hypothetical protein [Gilliamella apicola]OCG46922.1 hypothetical protein A9G35_04515 [Gilliamella apicola]